MTQSELYRVAISLDPNYGQAYFNLSWTLPSSGTIQLLNGTIMTKQELKDKEKELKASLNRSN
jgi:hypothetical protein